MSRVFLELFLLLFNSAVPPAETGERSYWGDFPDESLGRLLAMSALSFNDVFNRSVEKFVENPPNITVRLNR
jgi:hypothetical protein